MSLGYLTSLYDSIPVPDGTGAPWCTSGLPVAAQPPAIAALAARSNHPILIITPRQESADRLTTAINTLLPANRQTLVWSAPDPLPYEQLPHDADLSARRIAVLDRLRQNRDDSPPVIIATIRALIAFVRTANSFDRDTISVAVGERLNDRSLVERLVTIGYRVEPIADQPGTISRRGGIIDAYSPGSLDALRIEFFGDEIDSIRRFDPETQRSTERVERAKLLPPIEFDLAEIDEGLDRLSRLDLESLRPEVRDEWNEMLERVRNGDIPEAVDLLACAFPGNNATVLDHLPRSSIVVEVEPDSIALEAEQIELRAAEVRSALEEAAEIPRAIPQPYRDWHSLRETLDFYPRWVLGADDGASMTNIATETAFADPPMYAGRLDDMFTDLQDRLNSGWRLIAATEQSERVRDLFADHDIYPRTTKRGGATAVEPPRPGTVDVVHAALDGGFALRDPATVVLTDREMFGIHKRPRPAERPRQRRFKHDGGFEPGSYVVHVEHGVGHFTGLVTLATSGVEREYLQVDYADGDRLYIPVDQSDRIAPYEAPAGTPKINRLSSNEWRRTKSRVRNAVREMAFELLQIYASREVAEGHGFPADTTWDVELAESFPYRETPDQDRAIVEVKNDLEAGRPMDRLVCGDVGYGKTEVALRAAFKVVNAGWQAAVLVPTTVLALQHYQSFRERLAAFPVRVEMLSRLRSRREQRRILEDLSNGSVDIVIGTHRMLQRDVSFKRLGLLIVDEEQRFGVRHKEYIKRQRAEIDVLTMTATPIPRTLYMALTGLRDLSMIATAPHERVPVRTFVTETDDLVVREAILREMARGGQVFVVHNRVHSIYQLAGWLEELVPEASFNVGHGQMEERDLEQVILSFMQHEYDVLICTTIIESGVDIPNANTIIIDNAHAMGLTQLYQLRGRVGRGINRAYAYLLYPPNVPLSTEARQRLSAIREATELGSGFQIAMRDLEIRGTGNILGAQQSGHIAAVGLDLYTRMLSHAVEEIRAGHPIMEAEEVNLDIGIDARIPEDYIEEESVRLAIYQEIAGADTGPALRDVRAELVDRFGPPPPEVDRIIDLVKLRHRARDLGVTTIVEREGTILVRPVMGSQLDQQALKRELGDGARITPNQVRMRLDGLRVERWQAIEIVLDAVERIEDQSLVSSGNREPSYSSDSKS